MPRQPRIQFPGAGYHVMARGDRREAIVLDDQDRALFVATFDFLQSHAGRCGRSFKSSRLSVEQSVQGVWPGPSKRPRWLKAAFGLSLFDYPDGVAGRRRYIERLEGLSSSEKEDSGFTLPEGQSLHSTLRRGWYWGSEAFKERIMETV